MTRDSDLVIALDAAQSGLLAASKAIQAVEGKRDCTCLNAAKAAKEGIAAFTWVLPAGSLSSVEEGREASEFWANKLRKEGKEKGETATGPAGAFANALRANTRWLAHFEGPGGTRVDA